VFSSSGRVVLATTGGERRAVSRLALGGWGEGEREAHRLDRLRGSQSGRYTEQRASRGEGQPLVGTINQYTNLRRAPSVTTWSVIRDSRCMYSIHGSGAAATGRSNDSGSENG
jgi:hypothetical protein